ncbi:hypothetical protein LINGRAPRIM_LOCUS1243 [Linum grandiflorum]
MRRPCLLLEPLPMHVAQNLTSTCQNSISTWRSAFKILKNTRCVLLLWEW